MALVFGGFIPITDRTVSLLSLDSRPVATLCNRLERRLSSLQQPAPIG